MTFPFSVFAATAAHATVLNVISSGDSPLAPGSVTTRGDSAVTCAQKSAVVTTSMVKLDK